MNPTTASVVCPNCGQAFLSMQNSMAGVAQCPHCAHSAPRAHFGTQIQVVGIAPGRRQVAQSQPLASPPLPSPQAAFSPPPAATQQAAWPGLQPLPQPPPAASIARMTLQPSQALMPTGASVAAGDYAPQPHLSAPPWKNAFLLLALAVVASGAFWLWWDHTHVSSATSQAASPQPAVGKPRLVPIPQLPPKKSAFPPPDTAAFAADAKALVTEFFAADTSERRAACVHNAEKHGSEIEALFGATAADKIELRVLARIPGLPLLLPGGQPVPLFKLVTSKCANGALIRLESGTDGKRRIHWPLLLETHEAKLASFVKRGGAEVSAWFHVGLRPSHGLDIPADLRPKYLTFDLQVAGGSDPHFVACVERDTPLGRFMDRETEWGKAYLARLLLRRLDIPADSPCVVVLDCEGASER